MDNKTPGLFILMALIAVHIYLARPALTAFSPTYDEPPHLTAGYVYWKTGDYRYMGYYHPPFGEMWAGLPLIFLHPMLPLQHPTWLQQRWSPPDQCQFADAFLYHNRVPADKMLAAGRAMQVALSCLLGVAVFVIAAMLGGLLAGAIAGGFWAVSPAVLANATIVSTDLAFAFSFFLLFGCLALRRRRACDIAAGIALGLCFASKYFALAVPPIIVMMIAVDREFRAGFQRWPIVLVVAALTLGAVYRFTDLDVFWQGFMNVFGRSQTGRSSFMNGQHGTQGWLLYFPFVFAVKTTIPLMIALGFAGVAAARRAFRVPVALWVPPLLFFAMACVSKVQIGQRHILAVYPFLFVIAGLFLARSLEGKWVLLAGGLLAWNAVAAFLVRPHFLAYFNEFVGGPSNGYKYLTDSNVDWGQGLKLLGQSLTEAEKSNGIYLCYFGVADPRAYGIRFLDLGSDRIVPRGEDANMGLNPTTLAISVTNLQATYFADKHVFDWLKAYEPARRIAHSIFVYDFHEHPEALEKIRRMRS